MLQPMNSNPHATLAASLVQRFTQVFASGRRLRSESPVGVPGLDRAALVLLMKLSGREVRVGELAELCHLDLSTASRHASSLTQLGLITKVPDPEDRRAQLLTLTPEGTELSESIRWQRGLLFAEILADWDEEDLRRFDAYLARFVNDVERHLHSPRADENQQGNH